MKIFDDMTYTGTAESLMRFIQRLDQSEEIGSWKRDRESENSHASVQPAVDTDHCFRTLIDSGLPNAFLWMFPQNSTAWRVTNIVPVESNSSFSEEIYYRLLISFRESTLLLAVESGVAISVPQLNVGPEHWLNQEEISRLRFFSNNANRSTGSAHPRDRANWNSFVISVHNNQTAISGSDLFRILMEHEGWSENIAQELAIEFEQELSILRDFAKSA